MKSICACALRHRLVNDKLPIGPARWQRFIQIELAARFAVLSRGELVSDRAIIRDEQREMILRLLHRVQASSAGRLWLIVSAASMWIGVASATGTAFAADRDEHCRIVRLITERTRFPVLDPEIGPVILDPERERCVLDRHVASKIFCDIEDRFLFAQPKLRRGLCFRSQVRLKRTFAPVLPPLRTWPICSSGALLNAKIDSSNSITPACRCSCEAVSRCSGRSTNRDVVITRSTSLQFDGCETHRKISVLRIISEEPAVEMLIHHRSRNCEMQRRPACRSFSGGGRARLLTAFGFSFPSIAGA